MRVEHHLLRLARIGANEHHAAHAEPDVGDFHRRRHPVDDDDLVAPVKLVGFARRKRQGNVGFRRRARVLLAPAPRIAANSVVAALVAERPQRRVNAGQRQPLARRRLGVRRQQPVERLRPRPELRPRLDLAVIGKRRLPRPQDPPHRVARQMQGPRDLLDRLPLAQMLAPYPTNRLHNQHPLPPASRQSRQTTKPEIGGSILHADDAPQGVNFARRNTSGRGVGGAPARLAAIPRQAVRPTPTDNLIGPAMRTAETRDLALAGRRQHVPRDPRRLAPLALSNRRLRLGPSLGGRPTPSSDRLARSPSSAGARAICSPLSRPIPESQLANSAGSIAKPSAAKASPRPLSPNNS